VEEVY